MYNDYRKVIVMYKKYENMSYEEFRKLFIDDSVIIDFELPKDVQEDIEGLEKAIKERSLIDCLQGELYSSINNNLNHALTDNQCRIIRKKYKIG